jgi:hypothetical protein
MDEIELKFGLKVLIIVFLIFSLIVFINSVGLNLNMTPPPKKLIGSVNIETMEGMENSEIPIRGAAFCENYRGSSNSLNEECMKLTKRNCLSTSCCVYTSEDKCLAGGQGGPTFNSDIKGKTKNLDYYYYQDQCYGPKCP